MAAHLSLGIIGHVDHGKTSLVKALSGIDTDRLKEEKERGMSIVLGFAFLEFNEGIIDLIDVPGHENFIRTMVSGATGIDAALLVVDANEGVKPQTIEHLAITGLLGIRRGVIAITKSDLVDSAARDAVMHRLRPALKGTHFEFAPRIFTSVKTGEGLDTLTQALKSLLQEAVPPLPAGQFWLPVDRVFSIAGRGTVVTGTLRLGELHAGQEVEIMPGGRRATVRQIEVHGREVEVVRPGQRAGINLRHLKSQEIARGDALATVGLLRASTLLDARATLLAGQENAWRDGRAVRLLFGTTEVRAHARILSSAGAGTEPGHAAIVQFRTLRPVAALAGEPFIVRCDSPAMTIGGGRFLDTAPKRHRRTQHDALARLQLLAGGSGDDVLLGRVRAAGHEGIAIAALAAQLAQPESRVMDAASVNDAIVLHDRMVFYRPFFDGLGDLLHAAVARFHQQHPTRYGAPLSYCRASMPQPVNESLFKCVLRASSASGRIDIHRGLVRVAGYDPLAMLCEEDRTLAALMEARFQQGGVMPPDIVELVQGDARRDNVFHMLVEHGVLLLLPGEQPGKKIAFHRDVVKEIDRRLSDAYPPPAQFTVSEARALLASTRKFMVPLLEYFDMAGYTRRRGDKRVMVNATERRG